jgi:hypothetical protein
VYCSQNYQEGPENMGCYEQESGHLTKKRLLSFLFPGTSFQAYSKSQENHYGELTIKTSAELNTELIFSAEFSSA